MTTYTPDEWLVQDTRRRRAERKAKRIEELTRKIRIAVVTAIAILGLLALIAQPYTVTYERTDPPTPPQIHTQTAYAATYYVTGYNTVPEQTDSTPCIAASGADICGRTDVVACPRAIALGTEVEIDGKTYVCEDRLAKKYDHRIDISCDKDRACPAEVTGYKEVVIKK